MGIYNVESGKTSKLKKAYVVENGKTVKLKKAYLVENGKLVKLWSSETGRVVIESTQSSDGNANLYWSDDCVNWNLVTLPFNVSCLYYENGYFTAVGGAADNKVYFAYSKDCVSWTVESWGRGFSFTPSPNSYYLQGKWWIFLYVDPLGTNFGAYSEDLVNWTISTDYLSAARYAIHGREQFCIATVGGQDYYCAEGNMSKTSYTVSYCRVDADVSKSSNWTSFIPFEGMYSNLIGTPYGLCTFFMSPDSGTPIICIRRYVDDFKTFEEYSTYVGWDSLDYGIVSIVYNEETDEIFFYHHSGSTYKLDKRSAVDFSKIGDTITIATNETYTPKNVFLKKDEGLYISYNQDSSTTRGGWAKSPDGIEWTKYTIEPVFKPYIVYGYTCPHQNNFKYGIVT